MLWPCHHRHWSISLVTMMTIPASRFLSASAPFSTSSQVSGRMRRKSRCSMDLWHRHRWHRWHPRRNWSSQGGRNRWHHGEKWVKHPEQNGEKTWRKIGKEFLEARLARSSRWTSGHLSGLLKVAWFLVSWCLPKMKKDEAHEPECSHVC